MSFANPEQIVDKFALMSGEEVVEFGCGIGSYTLPCAQKIGASGKIYAVDVQKNLLERLKNEAKTLGVGNIEYIWGDIEDEGGVKLKDGIADAVLMVNILFQIEDRHNCVKEAKRLLRPGGRVLVVDWSDSYAGLGPHPDQVIMAEEVEKIFDDMGFKKLKTFMAGDHHYGLIFQKMN